MVFSIAETRICSQVSSCYSWILWYNEPSVLRGIYVSTVRAIHGSGGSGFFPTYYISGGLFSTRNWPVTVTGSSVWVAKWRSSVSGEPDIHQCPDSMRSCQIHPRSDEISLDLTRFLPNLDEKSSVRQDSVFIVPEIDGFKWKSGQNLEKKWPDFMVFWQVEFHEF